MKHFIFFISFLGIALTINLRTEDGLLTADVEKLAADLYEESNGKIFLAAGD